MSDYPRLHYFNPDDDPKLYTCGCGKCSAGPSDRLLHVLDQCRHVAGVPFRVTSGPRCSEYNDEIGGSENSEHIDNGKGDEGTAADIYCPGSRERFLIVSAAIQEGVTRIGIGKDFLHLGVSSTHPGHVIWTYYG
jgi:hypothetical protein